MSYAEIEFCDLNQNEIEILIALLSKAGYSGFEFGDLYLKAYITTKEFDGEFLEQLCKARKVKYHYKKLDDINWNGEWEKNFAPVSIKNEVSIRAKFHDKPKHEKHDIVITPKMSFGTGHHETTSLMIEQMLDLDFKDKIVLDFGTGTGLLAILAEKLGASKVIATDNDDNCIENAIENIEINGCKKVVVRKDFQKDLRYDIILANINKNTIVEYLPILSESLKDKGLLIISGFLKLDEETMKEESNKNMFDYINTNSKKEWLCMRFSKNEQMSF